MTLVAALRGITSTISTDFGHLVRGEAGLGEGDHVVGRRRATPALTSMIAWTRWPHSGSRSPIDDDVGDRGMVDQRRFDLGREHVGAAADDQVDAPIGEVQVAVVVDVAHVADGGQPVGGDVERTGAEVGRPAVGRRLHVDVADLAGRERQRRRDRGCGPRCRAAAGRRCRGARSHSSPRSAVIPSASVMP